MERIWTDIRYALRTLTQNRVFALTALVSLALGIGANVAIFSMVDAILLAPLPYGEPERLVQINQVLPKIAKTFPSLPVMARSFELWRKESKTLESVALVEGMRLNLTGAGEPERLGVIRASASLFPMFGVQAQVGRTFTEEEDSPGKDQVALLADGFWRRRFQADPGVVGKQILLDGKPFVVVGVLPAAFSFARGQQMHSLVDLPERVDAWKPLALTKDEINELGDFNYGAVGRLRAGVAPGEVAAELAVLDARVVKDVPELELRAHVAPLQETWVGDSRRGLLVLSGAVGFVLLIVCANVANLLLSRGAARQKEFAVRMALGASRGRLLRLLFTESLLLSLAGGAAGVVLAGWALEALLPAASLLSLPRLDEVTLNSRVLAFALGLCVVTALAFGLLPAWRAARNDPQEALQAGGSRSATGGPRTGRMRSLLVALEVAASTVLLIGAGLLLSSFVRLMKVDRGFRTESVVTASIPLPESRYGSRAKKSAFFGELVRKAKALPGVEAAGLISLPPLTSESNVSSVTLLEGPVIPLLERPTASYRMTDQGYFGAIGIPLRSGRLFDDGEIDAARTRRDGKPGDPEQPLAVVMGERLAKRLWPGQSPLGKQFRRGDEQGVLCRVVGTVGDVRNTSLAKEPGFMVYMPYTERPAGEMTVVARTSGDARSFAGALREQIRQLDAELPAPAPRTMEAILSQSTAPRRFQLWLVAAFAVVALALAAIGLNGVISYNVSQRRGEFALRMALGAAPGTLRSMVLGQVAQPVALGLAAGLAGSLLLGQSLQSLLFEIQPVDPLTYGATIVLLAAVAAMAALAPAARAARTDPATALRYE